MVTSACPDPEGITKLIINWTKYIPAAASTGGNSPTALPSPFTIVSISWPSSRMTAIERANPTIMAPISTSLKPFVNASLIDVQFSPETRPTTTPRIMNSPDISIINQTWVVTPQISTAKKQQYSECPCNL